VTCATKKPFRLVSSTDSSAQYPCALSAERPLARANFMLGVYCNEDSKPPGTPSLGADVGEVLRVSVVPLLDERRSRPDS
jgi:hypothetical protein